MSNSIVFAPACEFDAAIASRRVHSVAVHPASAGVTGSVSTFTVKSGPVCVPPPPPPPTAAQFENSDVLPVGSMALAVTNSPVDVARRLVAVNGPGDTSLPPRYRSPSRSDVVQVALAKKWMRYVPGTLSSDPEIDVEAPPVALVKSG